jgi:hypothetical protein
MPGLKGQAEPEDDGLQYDFSRIGGFRMAELKDLQKAQLLHRVGDWAEEVMIGGLSENRHDPRWRDGFAPLLESLMKAANQVALYIDNDQLRWDGKRQ